MPAQGIRHGTAVHQMADGITRQAEGRGFPQDCPKRQMAQETAPGRTGMLKQGDPFGAELFDELRVRIIPWQVYTELLKLTAIAQSQHLLYGLKSSRLLVQHLSTHLNDSGNCGRGDPQGTKGLMGTFEATQVVGKKDGRDV
jgi:hypothetical protein